MLPVQRSVSSALDVAGAHTAYLARDEEQGASSAELGTLVPAPEVPLHGWEEQTAGSTDEEANDIQLVDVVDFILGCVSIPNKW